MSKKKRFSKELFEENDQLAKTAAVKYFTKKGFDVQSNPDRYAADLLLFSKEGTFVRFVECEIKKVWKEDVFPYENVQFPKRKEKYVKAEPITFFMINNKGNRALLVEGTDIIQSPLKEVPNKYVYKGEMFYQVDLKKVTFVELE